MMEKKYLIYLDILGFEELAKEIADKKSIDGRIVRKRFVDVIKERVEVIESRGEIVGKKDGGGENWVLVTDSLDKVFSCIFEILDHDTGYKNYKKIPLEIAIGVEKYDKWARFDNVNLIIEEPTIKFLKTKILNYYHEWYKEHHHNRPIKSTFIVLTELTYYELEPLDRKICQKIECKHKKDSGEEEIVTFFVTEVDKVYQRGRVFEFLEIIGIPESKLYNRINDLYVPPCEYEEMKEALEKDRIVFIAGTPEYGKTYTAIRLLWEYFCKGYKPRWIYGGEEKERRDVRKRLEDIEKELKPYHIIYFEDPFGKIEYEKKESLEREIGTIIDSVHNTKDVYVVITSREEVFKEFKRDYLSSVELEKFEKKLSIKKPSYDHERRKEILLKWAEAKDCKWLKNENLTNVVLKYIKDGRILPTPLSIKDFTIATVDVIGKDELIKKIEEKSRETVRSFVEEIENMPHDKVLFLLFPFISDDFSVDFVRREYEKLVKELEIEKSWEFDEVLNWFKGDKVDVIEGKMMFSHPSYLEALDHLLVKKGQPHKINKDIFSKVLFRLSERDEHTQKILANFLAPTFDKLSENVKDELMLKFSKEDECAKHIFKIGSDLVVSNVVQWKAIEILKAWKIYYPSTKFSTVGIAAAILYISGVLLGEWRSLREIAKVAGVSKETIRRLYREVDEHLDIEVRLNDV